MKKPTTAKLVKPGSKKPVQQPVEPTPTLVTEVKARQERKPIDVQAEARNAFNKLFKI